MLWILYCLYYIFSINTAVFGFRFSVANFLVNVSSTEASLAPVVVKSGKLSRSILCVAKPKIVNPNPATPVRELYKFFKRAQ